MELFGGRVEELVGVLGRLLEAALEPVPGPLQGVLDLVRKILERAHLEIEAGHQAQGVAQGYIGKNKTRIIGKGEGGL